MEYHTFSKTSCSLKNRPREFWHEPELEKTRIPLLHTTHSLGHTGRAADIAPAAGARMPLCGS